MHATGEGGHPNACQPSSFDVAQDDPELVALDVARRDPELVEGLKGRFARAAGWEAAEKSVLVSICLVGKCPTRRERAAA